MYLLNYKNLKLVNAYYLFLMENFKYKKFYKLLNRNLLIKFLFNIIIIFLK